jgi:hypothetical protein
VISEWWPAKTSPEPNGWGRSTIGGSSKEAEITVMNIRQRKLVGTVIFVAGSVFYFFLAITIAIARLPGTSMGAQLLFYLVTTLIWFFFSALLIRWMQKPDPKQTG